MEPISLDKIRRYSLNDRKSKVDIEQVARELPGENGNILAFIDALPDFLAASDLKQIVQAIADAHKNGKPVILSMGGHPIKVGLSPIIIDLMRKKIITAIATNGSAIIHDFELAYMGRTSEDVAAELQDGSFGMAKETGSMLNLAINKYGNRGLGQAIGKFISESECRYPENSLFATVFQLGIPATVHVAVGTDIIHMHPEADGAAIGNASLTDFKIFCTAVSLLEGGVFLNLGSAVIMPEVFLKTLTLVRNLGHKVDRLTTITMDFNKHYRPMENVVRRPTMSGGKGYYLTGHHEIMFPLLAAGVREKIANNPL